MDKKPYVVNLSVGKAGNYKWITEFNEYSMDGIDAVVQELLKQEDIGVLSSNKSLTKVLLHIDKQAPWDPVAQLVYRLKTSGYLAYPVYEASP